MSEFKHNDINDEENILPLVKKYIELSEGLQKRCEESIELQEQINQTLNQQSLKVSNEMEKVSDKIKIADDKINEQINEANNLKTKILELMGIFIAIFSFIIANITGVAQFTKLDTFNQKVGLLLIINGSVLIAIFFLLLSIKMLFFDKKVKYQTVLPWVLAPLCLVLIGVGINI